MRDLGKCKGNTNILVYGVGPSGLTGPADEKFTNQVSSSSNLYCLVSRVTSGLLSWLHAQSRRNINLWQVRREFSEKSSKIVPLGAPL
jgi:hypothetical protein